MNKKPVVCITGCSSGFGLSMAVYLASSCQVIATIRDLSKRGDLDKALKETGAQVDIQRCDVTNAESIQALQEYIVREYGELQCLINNAGLALAGFFEELDDNDIRQLMETNFFGLLSLTRVFLPLLRASNRARIINISSIAGLTGTPTLSVYNASKWAVEGFSEALYFELKPYNIDVVCIEPGPFQTKIFDENLKLSAKILDTESIYYEKSVRLLQRVQKSIQKGMDDPIQLAYLVEKIIFSKTVKFRYLIGRQAKIRAFLKKYLPFSCYQWLVFRVLNKLWAANHGSVAKYPI